MNFVQPRTPTCAAVAAVPEAAELPKPAWRSCRHSRNPPASRTGCACDSCGDGNDCGDCGADRCARPLTKSITAGDCGACGAARSAFTFISLQKCQTVVSKRLLWD